MRAKFFLRRARIVWALPARLFWLYFNVQGIVTNLREPDGDFPPTLAEFGCGPMRVDLYRARGEEEETLQGLSGPEKHGSLPGMSTWLFQEKAICYFHF